MTRLEELQLKNKEKRMEVAVLKKEYKKKFGVDYAYCMIEKKSFEEEIAELKDCIENNHLQSNELPEDYNPNYQY